jgi:D-cysteine desulfhydrase
MFDTLTLDTPIQKITWPDAGDNSIYIRRDDLIPYSFGGNKVRIGAAFMRDMQQKGCDALIMYGDRRSNLCRVLAAMCRDASVPCLMIATEEHAGGATPFNERILEQFDIRILACEKDKIAETVDRAFSLLRGEGRKPYYIYGDRTGSGNEGCAAQAYADAYAAIPAWETANNIRFDRFFVPYGTGCTQGGLLTCMIEAGDERPLTGISISSRTRERALHILQTTVTDGLRLRGVQTNDQTEALIRSRIHIETDFNCGGYGLFNAEITAVIDRMLQLNSIPMDPTYTGKAFAGMLRFLFEHDVHGENILFLHTGGLPLFFDYLSSKPERSGDTKPC